MSEMDRVLEALTGNDNSARKEAEGYLENAKKTAPAQLVEQLFTSMNNENLDYACLSCILFKNYFLKDEAALSATDCNTIRPSLYALVDFDKRPYKYLRSVGDLLGKIESRADQCKELLPKLVVWGNSESPLAREFAMYLFEILGEVHLPIEVIKSNTADFMEIFRKSLSDPEIRVRVAALKATAAFLCSIDDTTIVMQFQGIVELMLETTILAIKADEEKGRESLETFAELAEYHAEVFSAVAGKLVQVVSEVMAYRELEEKTRITAAEIVATLTEKSGSVMRKVAEMGTFFFPACMQMLSEVPLAEESEQAEWAAAVEEDDVTKNDVHAAAKGTVNAVALSLGEKVALACTTDLIKSALADGDWRRRQAGYTFIGCLTEPCKGLFGKNIDEMLKMSAAGVVDAHHRVRYAGLMCLALLITEQSPKVQKKYHAEILPQLLKLALQEELLKMKTQAVSATVNFVRGLIAVEEDAEVEKKNADVLEPYINDVLELMAQLLEHSFQQSYAPLQEEVLALLSCTATVIGKRFAPYYPKFMPALKQILGTTPMETRAQRDLRTNTIQSIGFLVSAVSDNVADFAEDVKEIAELLAKMILPGVLKDDDPQYGAILNTFPQLASMLKEQFSPYLPHIMDKLIADAKLDIDFKWEAADEIKGEQPSVEKKEDGQTSMVFRLKGVEEMKKVSLNTSALENKINACQVLRDLASNLKKAFLPYVEVTHEALAPLMNFVWSKAVRKVATASMQHLLLACSEEELMAKLFAAMHPTFLAQIADATTKKDYVEMRMKLKGLLGCTRLFQSDRMLSLKDVESTIAVLAQSLALQREARQIAENEWAKIAKKADEQELEDHMESLEKLDKVGTIVMDISGCFAKNYGEAVTEAFKTHLLEHFALTFEKPEPTEKEVLDAICFFVDVLEFLGEGLFVAMHRPITEAMLKLAPKYLADEEDRQIIQSITYGVGVVAQRASKQQFAEYLAPTFDLLNKVLSEGDCRENEDKAIATECAIGALGKLVYFQFDGALVTDKVASSFIGLLPLVAEPEEAQNVHKQFFKMVLVGNAGVVGEGGAHAAEIKQAVERIATTHAGKPELEILDDEGKEVIQAVQAKLA